MRINRVVRDIPTTNVVEGMKKANLRQIAQQKMAKRGLKCRCIRCREIRRQNVNPRDLILQKQVYKTDATIEYFLSFETDQYIAALMRLSLPMEGTEGRLEELDDQAIIRELHVYGPAVPIGESSQGDAQHIGLGSQLIEEAVLIAKRAGYKRLAVISAIGTREYYQNRGFEIMGFYQSKEL